MRPTIDQGVADADRAERRWVVQALPDEQPPLGDEPLLPLATGLPPGRHTMLGSGVAS